MAKADRATDWRALMRLGLGALRLSPEAFWSMTPRELDAAIIGAFGENMGKEPMTRARLDALHAQFPDLTNKEDEHG